MVENIALILEVHQHMSIKKAQQIAQQYLDMIHLGHIGSYRKVQCTPLEIFYVMFIRALVTNEPTIIIETPYVLLESLREIKTISIHLEKLNQSKKKIIILDTQNNMLHYKDCLCNMIKSK